MNATYSKPLAEEEPSAASPMDTGEAKKGMGPGESKSAKKGPRLEVATVQQDTTKIAQWNRKNAHKFKVDASLFVWMLIVG